MCVDLADHLMTWPSGGGASLRLCEGMHAAHAALQENFARVTSTIHWHFLRSQARLIALDQLAQYALSINKKPVVFTNVERIDSTYGSVNLLSPLA